MEKVNRSKGILVVFSAPSGTGKTSVLFEILKHYPDIKFSVSATTRAPREGEKDGINYYFFTEEEFDASIQRGDFLEWNIVYGNKYGTLKRNIHDALEKGESVIFDTDTIGAQNIKKLFPDAVLIFIVPPSPEVLHERLKKRNTETPELMEKRRKAISAEIAKMSEYDYIVVNDTFETAVSQVSSIIEAEKLKSSRILSTILKWGKYINGQI